MSYDPEFWSDEDAFGLRLDSDTLHGILEACHQSALTETGGILVGTYSDDLNCAVVMGQSGRPEDSRSGRTWFSRGTAGLQRWLDELWSKKERRYYLGEWHYHPGEQSEPSVTDGNQMKRIAKDPSYKCPEPILVIVGGAATNASDLRAFVFSEPHDSLLELFGSQNGAGKEDE